MPDADLILASNPLDPKTLNYYQLVEAYFALRAEASGEIDRLNRAVEYENGKVRSLSESVEEMRAELTCVRRSSLARTAERDAARSQAEELKRLLRESVEREEKLNAGLHEARETALAVLRAARPK